MSLSNSPPAEAVAIVGLAGRFPRARNLGEFWRNLRDGVESVSFFADEPAEWLPIEHAPRLGDPRYVKARAVLEEAEWFDAGFFGLNPREAAIMDPQHRVFLECAWEALEDAGCDPDRYPGLIGVFAGASLNTYLFTNLLTNPEVVKDFGLFSSMIMNDGDFVPTRVSYKLNLRGPSINVQTACSTSLVAVCLAAQSVLTYRCDVALAGGVSITYPPHRGQHHLEGGIMSRDGHCRAFDAEASGTVLGDGAGIVVLKRLSEALADGDRIHAVIKGHAVNNDGALKIGYTAPSVDGQAECIALAQAEAGIEPESVSYIEAHGTGTPLGDPIEIAGLAKAFGAKPEAPKTCGIGSVKSNIGHLDIAAGIAGLIKTVLALQHDEIPPSLHFQTANPKLELERTPFFINAARRPWPRCDRPRRAGVSSFGIGGTNAHVVIEEAPEPVPVDRSRRRRHLLVLSAKTPPALEAAMTNLVRHLETHPELAIDDLAFSLQTRRKPFAFRRAFVAESREDALVALRRGREKRGPQSAALATAAGDGPTTPTIAFLFPGQGAQEVDMGRAIYELEPVFRTTVDQCCAFLQPRLGLDLRAVLYPPAEGEAPGSRETANRRLMETRLTQPAMFVIEYALARLWMHYGVRPNAMLGHSLGEYVAACLADVFTLEDALAIVAERARLMQEQPAGAMLAVRLSEDRVAGFLVSSLSLAATNARGLCVVSGPFDAITALENKLGESGVASRRLATSHAFHSAMMEGAGRPLADFIGRFSRRAPRIPFLSNVTGTWITAQQATDPRYWATHLRQTVRFADGAARLLEPGARRILLEIGPGETLGGLVRQDPNATTRDVLIASSLGRGRSGPKEYESWLRAVGELWAGGVEIDWPRLHEGERRRYVPLPTYPFERKRYWIEPGLEFDLRNARRDGAAGKIDAPEPESGSPAAPVRDPDGAALQLDGRSGKRRESGGAANTTAELQELLAELSGIDAAALPAEASFYQLGFDSLFLTQASLAITRRFGVEVAFRELRDDLSSIARLAAYLETRKASRETISAPPPTTVPETPPAPVDRQLPLSEAQRELWYAAQLGQEVSASYNESSNILLRGALDVPALQRAFRRLILRHGALRTSILPNGMEQRIAATSAVELPVRDLASLAPASREVRVHEFINAELERPFDLTKGPLFRAHLMRIEPERHLLVIVVHHIVCDGWSLGVLQKDLGELYTAEIGGGAGPANAPRFGDYLERQSRMHETPGYQAAEQFWLGQFASGVPILDLPGDHPRPSGRSYAGGFLLHTLPPDLTARLQELGARHESTMFTVLFAAFTVLLSRLSGQSDLVAGIPAAAQVMDGVDQLVGHFANLLPVRTQVAGDIAFSAYLRQVRRQLAQSLEHWRYPFGHLLRKLNLARDSSRMPLANVVFNSTRLRGTVRFGDLVGEVEGNAKRFSHFDLNFNFAVTAEGVSLGAYYSTELFERETIARWLGHFEVLVRGIVAAPETRLAELPLLSPAQREQMLIRWNDTRMPYERNATLAELFAAQVARTPDAVAVVAGRERITYRELDRRAERLSRRLRAAGIGADTLVGVLLERSPDLLAAIWGILKAGGAYVPMDPAYPADRLEFIATDTNAPLLLTQRNLVPKLPAGGFDFMLVDDEDPAASRVGRALQKPNTAPARATSLAYVIYTSGSTGRPKGVAIPQRGVVALVAWARQLYQPEELDGVLFSTSASFDISVFEIFCPLCLGGKIILADNILQLGALAAASEIRFLSGVPSALAEVVRLKLVPSSVTTVALAGEQFPQPLVDALYALPHIRRVFELYGPTEATVYSTGSLRQANTHPTLGRPFPNEQIYILDSRLQPVPIGVQGELCIGGDKLAREYLHRPELTAEKFIPNPLLAELRATIPGGAAAESDRIPPRLYRTGDLARWTALGTVESLGRADHQVKVRGYRIELGEVEAALAQHAAVAEAVVIARPDPAGNNRLLAYALARAGCPIDARDLRQRLRQQLPEYLVPSAVTVLERWPLTANGKLDRKALPDPERTAADHGYVAPVTTTEELLAEIWREVLAVARAGIHDNFFELGGHSLLAAQVLSRIHDALEVELSMRQFFGTPTIAGLAVAIEAALISEIKAGDDAGARPAAPEPCVPAEERP